MQKLWLTMEKPRLTHLTRVHENGPLLFNRCFNIFCKCHRVLLRAWHVQSLIFIKTLDREIDFVHIKMSYT